MTIKELNKILLTIKVCYLGQEFNFDEWRNTIRKYDYDSTYNALVYMLMSETDITLDKFNNIIEKTFALDILTPQQAKDLYWQEKGYKDEQDFVSKLNKVEIEEEIIC